MKKSHIPQAKNENYTFLMKKYHKLGSKQDRLKKFRKERGLTQQQLADDLGIDQSTLAHIERGKTNLSISNLEIMVLRHNLNPIWYLTGKGPMLLSDTFYDLESELLELEVQFGKEEDMMKYLLDRIRRMEQFIHMKFPDFKKGV